MEYTDNILLNTPQDADGFDVGHFNDNSDFLDGIIGGDVSSIAAGEKRNVATQAHAVGSYLTIKNGTMGGKLYKVTSAIAAGNVISTSTNVQETSLVKEIKTLQDSLSWKSVDINLTMTNEETSYTKTVTQLINATCVILLCSRPSYDVYTVLPMIIRSDKAKSGTGLASKPLRSDKMFGNYDFTIDVDIEWSTGLVRIRNGYRGSEVPALTLAKAMYLK